MNATTRKKSAEKRGRGRPPDPDARARRRMELLEAAATVFSRDGYAEADVQDIADTAGVGKGTVYRYFPSKKELFLAALDFEVEALGDHVDEEAAKVETPLEKMRAGTVAYIRWTDRNP
ncbi:MAG: TetR/AcrR family transcriptional regulator, partial [Planctomycetota bacterium]